MAKIITSGLLSALYTPEEIRIKVKRYCFLQELELRTMPEDIKEQVFQELHDDCGAWLNTIWDVVAK